MKTIILSLAVNSMLGIGALTINANAQEATPQPPQTTTAVGSPVAPVKTPMSIGARQKRQHARIKEGVKSGEITKHEARRLKRQEFRIQRQKQHFKAQNGGIMTPEQKAKIQRKLDKENRRIIRQKHDAQTR